MRRDRLRQPLRSFLRIIISSFLIAYYICRTKQPFFINDVQAATVSRQYGDVNWDGQVDSGDRLLIDQHIAASTVAKIGKEHPDWVLFGDDFKVADVNCDGRVDSRDRLRVSEYNAAARVPKIRSEEPNWYNYLRRYYRYNATLKPSTTKITLNLNGTKSYKMSVTRNYGRHCYLTFKPIGKKPKTGIKFNGWDKAKKTFTFTLIGNTAEDFSFRVNLYDLTKKTYITCTDVINVKVSKGSVTASNKANKLASIAKKEEGYQGRNSNNRGKGDYTKYGKFTGTDGKPWCAAFVSWCAKEAGISKKVIPRNANTLSMGQRSNSYKKWSLPNFKKLKRGDVIFFSRTNSLTYKSGGKAVHHVGIVLSANWTKGTIRTIEGNTGQDIVAVRDYTVNKSTGKITKSYGGAWNGQYFCGYISVK